MPAAGQEGDTLPGMDVGLGKQPEASWLSWIEPRAECSYISE